MYDGYGLNYGRFIVAIISWAKSIHPCLIVRNSIDPCNPGFCPVNEEDIRVGTNQDS
jgi:hypothetical protein